MYSDVFLSPDMGSLSSRELKLRVRSKCQRTGQVAVPLTGMLQLGVRGAGNGGDAHFALTFRFCP